MFTGETQTCSLIFIWLVTYIHSYCPTTNNLFNQNSQWGKLSKQLNHKILEQINQISELVLMLHPLLPHILPLLIFHRPLLLLAASTHMLLAYGLLLGSVFTLWTTPPTAKMQSDLQVSSSAAASRLPAHILVGVFAEGRRKRFTPERAKLPLGL